MKLSSILILVTILASGLVLSQQQQPANQLRLLVFGAHPDDPEKVGGTMAKYIQLGHKVMLVSLTNGDAGHQEMGGGPLAQRRYKETQCAGKAIGAEYVVLGNHDGELMPTLENRREVIRIIREFKPDLVFTPRPDDYHPDHRNTGLLVRDAAYMVTVPNVVAQTPHLLKNPIFIYVSDRFTKPTPFNPDVLVGIDDVIEKKIDMYHCHESQMYEWLPYNRNELDKVPQTGRREWLGEQLKPQNKREADRYRAKLVELYGQDKGSKIVYAEAFEVSEYGSQLRKEDVKKYFPFF
ncbi:MAG: PIG-L family deacetylase [Acidobacteria bacterium]|nr:MAG: PIG-L family deacetylase [Acidobacteriota bacterium]